MKKNKFKKKKEEVWISFEDDIKKCVHLESRGEKEMMGKSRWGGMTMMIK